MKRISPPPGWQQTIPDEVYRALDPGGPQGYLVPLHTQILAALVAYLAQFPKGTEAVLAVLDAVGEDPLTQAAAGRRSASDLARDCERASFDSWRVMLPIELLEWLESPGVPFGPTAESALSLQSGDP